MNLRGIANSVTQSINPNVSAQIYKSTGYDTADNGSMTPSYADAVTMDVQKQAISQNDLEHLDNLNLQGQFIGIYTNGNWCGMNRKKNEGGDLFVIGDDTWLVVAVPEIWPDWTRVVACLQLT
ncbi:hypothetical protein [Serratia sp. M24T3]|uniref:phage collar protein n=1 Tax=Serratia sp. M24T3 TaxID=932213 RepID=UPI00025B8F3D|nr:hypothetical protein [Serratia sp. M24T3]EIC83987.1 hypothetical protein SPM24T3_13760 [Serratia sp. M24T3]